MDADPGAAAGTVRILVVDDDRPTREETMDGLRRHGYEVDGAEDGLQAVHHLQRTRFDVVVTDIQMPHMDGIALLREVRRKGYAPVVIQTTELDPALREVLHRFGAAGVLRKGGNFTELVRAVKEAVRDNRGPSLQGR